MFVFGHLGIGSKLIYSYSNKFSRKAVLLGTILPDLIDKPIYYGLSLMAEKKGVQLGLISGTRTFGHTAIFLFFFLVSTFYRRSRILAAISLGIASHLVIDGVSDFFMHPEWVNGVPGYWSHQALLWPFHNNQFPVIPFDNMVDHLKSLKHTWLIFGEALGLILLLEPHIRIMIFKIRKTPYLKT